MAERNKYIEEWRQCVQCPKYEVSNYAQVRDIVTKEIIDPYPTRKGHQIKLTYRGVTETYYLDELVVRAFYGERPANHTLVHKDDNLLSNSADNLAWVPYSKAPLPKRISYHSPIHCVENGKDYESIYECSDDLGIPPYKITKSMKESRIGVRHPYTFELID